jgi:hypothetical protein
LKAVVQSKAVPLESPEQGNETNIASEENFDESSNPPGKNQICLFADAAKIRNYFYNETLPFIFILS